VAGGAGGRAVALERAPKLGGKRDRTVGGRGGGGRGGRRECAAESGAGRGSHMATTGRGSTHGAAGHLHTHSSVPTAVRPPPPPHARVEVERTPDHMQDGAGTRAGMDERREGAMFHRPVHPSPTRTSPNPPCAPDHPLYFLFSFPALRRIERRADPTCRFP